MGHAPEDVVAVTLYKMFKGTPKFEASPVAIHPVFYECRLRAQDTDMLNVFRFDTRDYFPFSDTLEESLDALQFAGYLERSNPRGTFFEIQPSIERLYETISVKFEKSELEILDQLAEKLAEQLQTKTPQTS